MWGLYVDGVLYVRSYTPLFAPGGFLGQFLSCSFCAAVPACQFLQFLVAEYAPN